MSPKTYEVNFDGIVGPSHNYCGLSYGNIPSMENKLSVSNPREAALQGLEKMKTLMDLGYKQAVMPPHERPHLPTLKALGFTGTDEEVLSHTYRKDPLILFACSSAAAMWTANAATTTPSIDSGDGHVHFTPANLSTKFHRSIEAEFTGKVLKAIFKNNLYFNHHPPLYPGSYFSDEGAANHTLFCKNYGEIGVHLFVYGRYGFKDTPLAPRKFPARQTLEASQAISRLHQIFPNRVIFAQQNPHAIDAGVFHNDVASVGNRNAFLYHQNAFVGTEQVINEIKEKVWYHCDTELITIQVPNDLVSYEDAVNSYFFNSQLLSQPDGTMVLIAPSECKENPKIQMVIEKIVYEPDNPIKQVHYFNLRESMRNGGGPACLRFRVVLTEQELQTTNRGVLLTDRLYPKLKEWITKHYRDSLTPQDMADYVFLTEMRQALDELTRILELGSIYDFQKS